MMIESSLEIIARELTKLVKLQTEKVHGSAIMYERKKDEPDTVIPKKKEKKAKPEKKVKPKKKISTLDKIAVKAFVDTAKKSKKLTIKDVTDEARDLVDGFAKDRKGYEKAKQVLRKVGAASLKDLAPEKYAEAVNGFRNAISILKGNK